MNEDEISGMFADISIADFVRESSAVSEHHYTELERTRVQGEEGFDSFVDQLLGTTRTAASVAPFHFQAFSVLHAPDRHRVFVPDDDETVLDYRERLRREAKRMEATWLYTVMLAPGRSYDSDENVESIDPNDAKELGAALRSGALSLCLCWFAEMIEQDETKQRAGIIHLSDRGVPGESVEGEVDEDKNPFHHVLR